MQFQVPQFIDIEDKVIGPFTIKQFLYLAGAGFVIFILYKIFNLTITITVAIPLITIAVLLGFFKPNNQPFLVLLKGFLGFIKNPDFYVWKKSVGEARDSEKEIKIIKKEPIKTKIKPEAKENLQDVAWKVEIEK